MKLVTYPDREFLAVSLAGRLAGELRSALAREERVTLVVPGGSTPGPVFDVLSGVDLDWSRVDVLPTDERWLHEYSERSNTRLIRTRLLCGPAGAARLHSLFVAGFEPEQATVELSTTIEALMPPAVTLVGMGADFHVASLFPGGDHLADALASNAPPLMAMRAPAADEPRVTLTLPALRGSLNLHILIVGHDKRAAIEAAEGRPLTEAPVAGLLSSATIHWAEW